MSGLLAEPGVEVRHEVRPRWVFALPLRSGLDGLTRVRGGVLLAPSLLSL